MQTILENKEKPAIDEMVDFIKGLSEQEQQNLNYFIQGIKFTKNVYSEKTA